MDYIYDDKELKDLIKKIEKVADTNEIKKINKEILNKVSDDIIPIIKKSATIGKDHKKSGVFRNGIRHVMDKHAIEYLDKNKIRNSKNSTSLSIDFEKFEYAFYLKFLEFGTSRIKKNSFIQPNYNKAYSMLKKEIEEKYSNKLNDL